MDQLSTINTTQISVYQRFLAGKRSPLTRAAYRYDLKRFAQFLEIETFDHIPDGGWAKLDPAMVSAYIEWLATYTSAHTGRRYSTATIARQVTAVRELLTEAMYCGLYPADRLAYIKDRITKALPTVTHNHHSSISNDDLTAILKAAYDQPGLRGSRDYLIFRLLVETGLRRAELAGLSIRDIERHQGVSGLVVRGKGDRLRFVGIEDDTHALILSWLDEAGQVGPELPIFCRLRKRGRGEEARFSVVDRAKRLHPRSINTILTAVLGQAGVLSRVTPHSFRVAFVTQALDGDAPILAVQQATGHTTTRMITEVYDRNTYTAPVSRFIKGVYKPEK